MHLSTGHSALTFTSHVLLRILCVTPSLFVSPHLQSLVLSVLPDYPIVLLLIDPRLILKSSSSSEPCKSLHQVFLTTLSYDFHFFKFSSTIIANHAPSSALRSSIQHPSDFQLEDVSFLQRPIVHLPILDLCEPCRL